jgi:C-terminal processing protease CtpA/Prc
MSRFLLLGLLLVIHLSSAQSVWDTPEGRARIFDATVNVFADNYWNKDYRNWDDWASEFRDDALSAETRADFDSVMRRMVSALEDDHSRWFGQVNDLDFDGIMPQGERGLGIEQSYLPSAGIVVERVFPETPASLAGLQRGDVIVRIGSEDLREASSYQISELLSSVVKENEVTLEIRRKSQRLNVRVTPEPINFGSVRDVPQSRMIDETTGYIYLPTFLRPGVGQEIHDLIAILEKQGATSLVLDLRNNPGGQLSELGLVLGAFIDGEWAEAVRHGELVWKSSYEVVNGQGRGRLETPEGQLLGQFELDNPVQFKGPLAVIVNRNNSSAGEVSALVLQNLERATIVGEKTLGNVEAIQDFSLPDGSVMMIAVANMEGINGSDFTSGITPDVEVSETLQELARGYDAPLAEAVKAVKELPFTPGKYF